MLRKIFFYPGLFSLCWMYSIKFNDIDYDLWARMAVGKIFFQTGSVLQNDIFSYTATKQWIDHEWGSGVIFYFLADRFGDIGLMLLKVGLSFCILFLITRIIKLQNLKPDAHKNILFYFLIILTVIFGISHTIRCQLFTFTFFTLWIYVLERVRLRMNGETRLLWIMPATMLLWVNIHGGFVAGLGLLFIYGAGEFLNKKQWLKYFIIAIPTLLTTFINPYGFKYLQYIFYATTMSRKGITEWQATDLFNSWSNWYSLKIVIAIALISIIFYFIKNRPKFYEIDKVKFILFAVTLYLGLNHIKHQTFFIITWASFFYHDFYIIFETIGSYITNKTKGAASKILNILDISKNAIIYIFILFAGCLFMAFNPVLITVPFNKYPVGSIEFVRQNNIKGNLLTVFHWGSYAAWKLYPNCLIAIDGRFEEVYAEESFYLVSTFMSNSSKPWDYVLQKYHTDIIILDKINAKTQKTYEAMKKQKEWKLVFQDLISAVFIRNEIAKDNYINPVLDPFKIIEDKYITKINFNKLNK